MNEKELNATIGSIVIGILFFGGMILLFAQQMFGLFLIFTILAFLAFLVVGVRDLFFRDEGDDIWCIYPLIATVVFGIVSLLFGFIGYGIGGTAVGQAAIGFYSETSGAEQQATDALNQAINQVVDDSCKTLPQDSCNLLKSYVQTAKTLQEVQDYADKLKTASDIAQKVQKTTS